MDPLIVLPADLHPRLLLQSSKELLPLKTVNSFWHGVVQNVFNTRFFLEYSPAGESLETFRDKYYVNSIKELKDRIQKFLKGVGFQKAVFICAFPFNDFCRNGYPPFLVIKWNLAGSTDNFFLCPSKVYFYSPNYSHENRFFDRDFRRIVPYVLRKKELKKFRTGPNSFPQPNDTKDFEDCTVMYGGSNYERNYGVKIALKICFFMKRLKPQAIVHAGFPGCSIMLNLCDHFEPRDVRLVKQIKELALFEAGMAHVINGLYLLIFSLAILILNKRD